MSKEKLSAGFNQEIYRPHLLSGLIEKALIADSKYYQQNRNSRKERKLDVFKSVWGEIEIPAKVSPSVAANCLRWVGYEAMGYTPAPKSFEEEMSLRIGSSVHYILLKVLGNYGASEQNLSIAEENINGRLDFLIQNPLSKSWQILDLKVVSDFAFTKISRQGLPEHLKNTKNIYNPSPEARLQILLYMLAKRKEGLQVDFGNIVYINRNTGKMKECLVVWDALAENETEEFLAKLRQAQGDIARGELPEPSVVSKYVCEKFCPYRGYCEPGRNRAAAGARKDAKRKPAWVYREARKKAEEEKARMAKLGVIQTKLPDF